MRNEGRPRVSKGAEGRPRVSKMDAGPLLIPLRRREHPVEEARVAACATAPFRVYD